MRIDRTANGIDTATEPKKALIARQSSGVAVSPQLLRSSTPTARHNW